MKVILFAYILVTVYGDKAPISSYSSLPYETDPGYFENSVHGYESQLYGYPDRGKNKFAFDFGKIVKTPYYIVKGASNYMTNVLSDIKGKFLQLKGSIARSKGNSLVAYGEDLLRKAYLFRGKQKHYSRPVHKYVKSYNNYNSPVYQNPVYPNPTYAEPKPAYNAPTPHFYAGISAGYGEVSGRGFGSPKASDVVHSSGFHPSPAVSYNSDPLIALASYQSIISKEPIDNNIPQGRSDKKSVKVDDRNVVFVKSVARISDSSSSHNNERPIPVPVPIAISPMRLVFPQLPH